MGGRADYGQAGTTNEASFLVAGRALGAAVGVVIAAPPDEWRELPAREAVRATARLAGIRLRSVLLRGDWWRVDGQPLVAFRTVDGEPVVLLPGAGRHYEALIGSAGRRQPVTAALAASLDPAAYSAIRPLPNRVTSLAGLVRFGLTGCRPDLLVLLLTGLAVGLLALLTPIATQIIVDQLIPAGDIRGLVGVAVLLLVTALAMAGLEVARGFAVLRLETRMGIGTQAALWDRLLTLPVPFFRSYTAGDLASRAMSIDAIRQLLTAVTVSSALAGLFALFNLVLLLVYDLPLALVAILLVALAVAVTVVIGRRRLALERDLTGRQARLAGLVLQLVTGISRLRVAGAEGRAFGVWAARFDEQQRITRESRTVGNVLSVFNAAFPTGGNLLLLGLLASGEVDRSLGTVVAFLAAFSGLLGGALALGGSALVVLRVVPLFEQARPLLEQPPEFTSVKAAPGTLLGQVRLRQVSFRYQPAGPLILDNVTIEAQPGEFVAIVGPSGSGKSTLIRLMLGFEQPTDGQVTYDGRALADLDVPAVRRQLGVVLQNGQLMPGDIIGNIIGSSLATTEDAWEAARLAGLADDIRALPMGMYTIVGEGSSTFSGGQRQRLLIARALVHRPRLLLFDEATSALDNATQAHVCQSLAALQTTRIVIAHRLTTIQGADRIYVLVGGRVVQTGRYGELAATPGPFQGLIRRQLV